MRNILCKRLAIATMWQGGAGHSEAGRGSPHALHAIAYARVIARLLALLAAGAREQDGLAQAMVGTWKATAIDATNVIIHTIGRHRFSVVVFNIILMLT